MLALPARSCQRAAHAFAGRAGWIVEDLVATKMPTEVSPAGSGDAAQWAAPITDRSGNVDRR